MIPHDELRADLVLYASGDLPALRMEELSSHLDDCPACARELAEIHETVALVRGAGHPAPELPPELERLHEGLPGAAARRRLDSGRWLQAAAVLVAFFAGVLADRWLTPAATPEVGVTSVKKEVRPASREARAYGAAQAGNGLSRGFLVLAELRKD